MKIRLSFRSMFATYSAKKIDFKITWEVIKRGTGLNCTKTKMHEVTKLHENKIARSQICTKPKLHGGTKLHETILQQGSILHELHFCTGVKKNKKN